jgi:hypothetical protein
MSEKMALANATKKFEKMRLARNGNVVDYYLSSASDGQAVEIQIDHSNNQIISIYPKDIQ